MVGDSPVTVFSEPLNRRTPLATANATATAAVETAFTVTLAAAFGYLLNLTLICTAASTTAGTWTFRKALGGSAIFQFPQPEAIAAAGRIYQLAFEMPWKTNAAADVFTITPSVATMGSWFLLPNGLYSAT